MTELRPLLESTDDELERALLRSVRAERPSGLGLRETALALGLAGSTAEALAASLTAASSLSHAAAPVTSATATSTAATSTAATSTAAASTAAASGGATGAVGAATLGVVGKSLFGGALVSFLALTTLDYSLGSSYRPQPVLPAIGATSAARKAEASPVPVAVVHVDSHDAEAAPPAAPAAASSAAYPLPSRLEPVAPAPAPAIVHAPSNATFTLPARPEPPLGATPNASLAAEIRVLDEARAALAAGNSARAASLLERYAANRPSAVLAQEAALLRVRLLLNQGDRASASQLARRIIHDHPESAHVDSLRSLAAEP